LLPREAMIEALLNAKGLLGNGFLLLPLQDSDHVNFWDESPFANQIERVIAATRRFRGRTIVVTQHPDKREISRETMAELCALAPNLLELDELEGVDNQSARLLPFASGLIAVSTGLVFQACLCDVPTYFMGRHSMETLLREGRNRQDIAWHLLTRVFYSHRYLLNGRWFWARMIAMALFRRGWLPVEALNIDPPDSVFAQMVECLRPQAPAILRPSTAERGVFIGNDTSRGHAGSRAAMAGLLGALRDAGRSVIGTHRCGETSYDNEALKRASLVVINGEDTFHDDTNDARALAGLMRAAQLLARPYWLVNCTLQNLSPEFLALVSGAARVITREARSHAYARLAHPAPELRVDSCVAAMFPVRLSNQTRRGIATGEVHPDCLFHAAGALLKRKEFTRLALEFPYRGHNFADVVAQLSTFECYLTGQYHGIYAAILAGTPFLPIPSNTHKIEGLLEWASVDIPFFNPNVDLEYQIDEVKRREVEYRRLREFIIGSASIRSLDFLQ
jgi:hypothetical protein